ncbi:antimicrobial ginkbilobin-2-like protein [Typha angustifolia]|uniref:antimicrobial ginkbilobin-2-like protein n=1 Tax=Typha angustifolia TaxID=59011 RepID=UPI003C2DA9EF
MFLLETKAPKIGFDIASVGSGHTRVDGLAQCRGDITSAACQKCIRTAGAHLRHSCTHYKDAIVWYDSCLLRYSNKEFFGEVDNDHRVLMWNAQIALKTLRLHQKVAELMTRLMKKAYLTPLLFATGEAKIGEGSKKLYGLAQCTKDLSGGDCKTCLQTAISLLPSCCNGKQGGRVLGGSCTIRYELYLFFDA